jgi:hypothetical protein
MDVHKNAPLTPLGREHMVKMVLSGQTPQATAQAVGVCPRTTRKCVGNVLKPNGSCSASREAQAVENKDAAAAIVAQLRALIPCSTDPAWLEKLAREVESRAHQR